MLISCFYVSNSWSIDSSQLCFVWQPDPIGEAGEWKQWDSAKSFAACTSPDSQKSVACSPFTFEAVMTWFHFQVASCIAFLHTWMLFVCGMPTRPMTMLSKRWSQKKRFPTPEARQQCNTPKAGRTIGLLKDIFDLGVESYFLWIVKNAYIWLF